VGPIGFPEMLVIAVLALLIFGPRKLPELGRSVGKALAEFRRASADIRFTIEEEMREVERQAQHAVREVEHAVEIPPDSVPAGSVTPPEPAAETSAEEKPSNGAAKPA
jgi:sec-independent protein translocase protein TatA